ncbi:hypothetical protein BXZ70DRAFT_1003295 [Cristinia sonorae]|uniref:Uncharacterized protein n=1 Tax=Cristinia sonorae TaxID=1940300 RepID=A0A8K0XW14_9AGAR|nr:hypothetical protein BXZ70DRAFT_1003295 [Cristinia sonorae]
MPIPPFLSRSKSLLNDNQSQQNFQSTSAIFPSLTKLNTAPQHPDQSRPTSQPAPNSAHPKGQQNPLVSFKLSGPSFLDVVLRDREDKQPAYIIETLHEYTAIYRLDAAADTATKVSTIQWPVSVTKSKAKSGRTIQMADGRWRDAEDLLKLGPLGSVATRKFSIPHYPHSLKWKLAPGGHFYCTTAGANGPFAVLDSAVLNAPPRLSVFHNCLEEGETRYQENYKGVPVLLLDYLVATSLLLVTEVQEWLDRPQNAQGAVRIPGSSSYVIQRWLAIIHNEPIPSPPASPTLTAVSVPWTVAGHRISQGTSSSGMRSATNSDFSSMPSTPATSVYSSYYSSVHEEIPPVPPLPQFSRHPDGEAVVYRIPMANHSSQSLVPTSSPPPIQPALPPSRPPSQPAPSRPSRAGRQLPMPPKPLSLPPSSQRPTTPSYNDSYRSADYPPSVTSSPPAPISERARSPSPSLQSNTSSGSGGSRRSVYRNSARSLAIRNAMPPPLPPPSNSLPLPPKLAQEYHPTGSTSQRSSQGYTSSPLGQSSSALRASNPDPVEETQQNARLLAEMALTARQYQSSPPSQLSSSQVPLPPEQAQSSPPQLNLLAPPVESFARLRMTDGGQVRPRDAMARASYAETIYELPPPAYDAIDFSAPQVPLPQRAPHG